ncbi:Flp family type IVb pilin [Hyphococcus flavus]|uniref:Flp family type IVb pilin n=1 Tax=Hyphococcus flavus TaxID=1866326 RepID=A0AAF0CEN6_9PROT|nr:Flp family type IVb pilin [Hyphococcus flavus]WDI30494.1 Flp family type IVb pilin [Hyphococcus flavus]
MDIFKRKNRSRREVVGLVAAFHHDEDGATAIEYGLIVALIFLAVVGAIRSYTNTTSGMYNQIDETLQGD